ncbi:MAG: flagellar hook-associated protein FlgK [Alphaproteobacteria bacterium]|nr:flagellar hook-associated protein FlgK [Alphaproteobacteria bacterium]
MSLTSALSIALSGLKTTTAQLQTAANNVANAQNPGYTQKKTLVSSVSFGTGSGGATVSGYLRVTDDALSTSLNNATSSASYLDTQDKYLQQVQAMLGSNSDNPPLSNALARFQAAWTEFSAAPESASQQASVIQAGVDLAAQVRNTASAITALNRQVTNDISTTVTSLNASLSKVALLNSQIATATSSGQPTGDLEDERDRVIKEIAAITNVTTLPRPNGQLALYTPGGLLLIDGPAAEIFSYDGTNITSGSGMNVTNSLNGGRLQAQIQFNYDGSPAAVGTASGSEVIRKLNDQLQAVAVAFTTSSAGPPETFAYAYNNATTATGELAAGFFTINGTNDASSFVVNANLLDGSQTVKAASGLGVVAALSAPRNFTADGLAVNNGTYTDLGTAFLSGFQQAANIVHSQSLPAQQQQAFYEQSLANATGVNVDSELVNLTALQSSYAASANVISTIKQMLEELKGIV